MFTILCCIWLCVPERSTEPGMFGLKINCGHWFKLFSLLQPVNYFLFFFHVNMWTKQAFYMLRFQKICSYISCILHLQWIVKTCLYWSNCSRWATLSVFNIWALAKTLEHGQARHVTCSLSIQMSFGMTGKEVLVTLCLALQSFH